MTAAEFETHVMPLRDKLYRFAMRLLANAEEARDTVQEVMIKMWESRKSPEEFESIEAWLMTMTRNRSLDKLKVQANRQRHLKVIGRSQERSYNPADAVDFRQQVDLVMHHIRQLPVVQRELIELRDFQEKSYEEMCELTGLDLAQVKVYLHRARKSVREKINSIHAYRFEH